MKRQLPSQTLEEQFLSPDGATVWGGSAPIEGHPRFLGEGSGLSLIFAVLVDASAGWRGVKVTPEISRELDALVADSKAKPGVRLAA